MTTNGRDLSPKETMNVLRGMAEEDAKREEEQTARVEAMTREERRAFLQAKGVDVAKVRARAAAVRARLAPRAAQGLAKDDEGKEKAKGKENENKKETAGEGKEGPSSEDAADRAVTVAKEPGRGAEVSVLRRRPELTWVIAAAAAAAVAGGAIAAGHYLHHEEPPKPEPPDDKQHQPAPPVPKAEDPVVVAAGLRQKAVQACAAEDWAGCVFWLDAAREKDPGGDEGEEWRKLRARAEAGVAREEQGKRGGG